MFYLDDVRERLSKEHGTTQLGQISKLASGEWATLTENQKQPYTQLASQDRDRYAREKTVSQNQDHVPAHNHHHPDDHSGQYQDPRYSVVEEEEVNEDEEDAEGEVDDENDGDYQE